MLRTLGTARGYSRGSTVACSHWLRSAQRYISASTRTSVNATPFVRRSLPTLSNKRLTTVRTMPLVTISSNIADALKKHEVVPEVVDAFDSGALITVTYDKDTEVAMGNTLKVGETQSNPTVRVTFNDTKELKDTDSYTLVLTDPDAPTKGDKKWSEYCHLLVTGIKLSPPSDGSPSDVIEVNYSQANVLQQYMGPAPPPKTGKHRYVFILYKEGGASPKASFDERATWGTGKPGSGAKDYASKHNLTPVAINFFYAQNEQQ